ncbi:MAG: alpha/beta hydrolase [Candidatus Hodarchaeota archaeon]
MNVKSIIDNPTVSNIIFYPRKTQIPEETDPNLKILQLKINEQISIGGFFFLNDFNFPTILLFHGNGEIASDYQYFASMFFNCDVNLAVVDFRGYGFSSGKPYYTSLISDALPIYKEFEKWIENISSNYSIFVQGRSLGSVCAAEIGSHNLESLKGVIFESGFASAYNMMTRLFRIDSPNLTPLSLSEYSNDTRVRKFKKPVLIIHGSNDWIIPPSEGELLFQNLPKTIEKQLIIIEGAGHNDILSYNEEYFTPLRKFINTFK